MTYTVLQPPTAEVVSVRQLARHLRIDWDGEDTDLALYIRQARAYLEPALGRAFLTQTVLDVVDLPIPTQGRLSGTIGEVYAYIPLTFYPVQSVVSVEREDQLETWGTLTADGQYRLDADRLTPRIWLSQSALALWPAAVLYFAGARPRVRVTYVAGYGDTWDTVPGDLWGALLRAAAWFYEHRDGETEPPAWLLPHNKRVLEL